MRSNAGRKINRHNLVKSLALKLRASEARFNNIVSISTDGIVIVDDDGVILFVNPAAESLFGRKAGKLQGADFGFPVVAGETTELDISNKDGNPTVAEMRVAVTEWEGKPAYLATLHDVTEKNRLAAEIQEINKSLEIRVAKAVEELRQKDHMLLLQYRQALMGGMINNIAHQWRQPLNTLGLAIQEVPLLYGSETFNLEYLKENTAKAMRLINFMSQTIDDFRNFFKNDKEPVTFGVNEVIARMLHIIGKSFENHKIRLVVDQEGEPMANGYPNEYGQVLLNILNNAQDALVHNKVEDALISIHTFSEGGKSVVTITDNAGGVPAAILNKVFDPYFTTKGPDKGTGIGLYMSKTIIEGNMVGRLAVRNTESGAEFRIEV